YNIPTTSRCYNCQGEGHYAINCIVKPRKREAAYLHTQLQIAQKEEAGIQPNSKEFDFMAAAGAYDQIEEVKANCTLKDNLQQTSTSGQDRQMQMIGGNGGNQFRPYAGQNKEEAGIQLQAEEFDLMAAATDVDEVEEVNANCILMANLQ
nr:hypothetical protein [Tanacetum cinerariifolium]